METEHFQHFQNEAKQFFRCRYIFLASNSWRDYNELVTVEFSIVFKLRQSRVNASLNFAAVTLFTAFKMCQHCVNAVLDGSRDTIL